MGAVMRESLFLPCAILAAALVVRDALHRVADGIERQTGAIRDQTYQIDWLVTHYAKPVRSIYGEGEQETQTKGTQE